MLIEFVSQQRHCCLPVWLVHGMPVFSTPDTGAISTFSAQTVIADLTTECAAGNFISYA